MGLVHFHHHVLWDIVSLKHKKKPYSQAYVFELQLETHIKSNLSPVLCKATIK